jgi:hypothetical protein
MKMAKRETTPVFGRQSLLPVFGRQSLFTNIVAHLRYRINTEEHPVIVHVWPARSHNSNAFRIRKELEHEFRYQDGVKFVEHVQKS